MAQCIVYSCLDYFVSIMPLEVEEERAGRGYMCFFLCLDTELIHTTSTLITLARQNHRVIF